MLTDIIQQKLEDMLSCEVNICDSPPEGGPGDALDRSNVIVWMADVPWAAGNHNISYLRTALQPPESGLEPEQPEWGAPLFKCRLVSSVPH